MLQLPVPRYYTWWVWQAGVEERRGGWHELSAPPRAWQGGPGGLTSSLLGKPKTVAPGMSKKLQYAPRARVCCINTVYTS